jgi:hypothetical protein
MSATVASTDRAINACATQQLIQALLLRLPMVANADVKQTARNVMALHVAGQGVAGHRAAASWRQYSAAIVWRLIEG